MDSVGEEWGGKGERRSVGERMQEGKDGGEKGWKREKVGRKRRRKGGEGSWGGIGDCDCTVLKIPLKSRDPRPTLTLRQIVTPVQDLVCAIWALFHEYF